ncbi:MAG: metallophosphoesterase [Anaerolineae bacterium]
MRIIHLTDPHLRHYLPGTSSVPGRESCLMPAILERAMALCRRIQPDLGVLSGDLVDVPSELVEDPETQTLAQKDYDLVHDLLQEASIPWVVLPGNHDLVEQVSDTFASSNDRVVCGMRVISFEDQERADHVPERVGAERRRFVEALRDGDDTPQIHVQHYVVSPRLDLGYPHTYADGEAMRDLIVSASKVKLVLSGHYHPGVAPFQLSGSWFSVPPALCVAPFSALVYDLDRSGLTWCRTDLGNAR